MRFDAHFVILQSALFAAALISELSKHFNTLQDRLSWTTPPACKAKANADIFQCWPDNSCCSGDDKSRTCNTMWHGRRGSNCACGIREGEFWSKCGQVTWYSCWKVENVWLNVTKSTAELKTVNLLKWHCAPMRPSYFIILLCPIPDNNFTHQAENAATRLSAYAPC